MEPSSHNPNFKPLSPESLTCIEQRRVEKEQQGKCSKTALNAMVVATTSTTANEAVQEEELLAVKDPDLQDGRVVPPSLGPFPEKLTGQPLEDFDPYYQREMTFCVVSKHFSGRRHIHRMSASRSLYIFSPFNKLRRIAIYIAVHRFFDIAVMLTIVVNCVFLALTTPIELSEWVFTGIYSLEMVVKIIAKGFILTKFTYLRDPWNWLDFLVVCLAFVTLSFSDLGNLTGIRTFRVLRALKTISIVPGLKTIVNALLKSMKMLGEVMLLIVFCLTVFALFALQVYLGVLRHKCVQNLPENLNVTDLEYAEHIQNSSNWFGEEGDWVVCGNASEAAKCPDGFTCLPDIGINPNFGYTGFDDFGMALLTSLQLITLDYWENVYNLIIEASGPWNMLFFIIVVFFGSFYLINLMLAVVAISYEEEANYSKDGTAAAQTGNASEFTIESGDQTKQNPPPNDAGESGEIEKEKPHTSTNDTPLASKEYPAAVLNLEEGKTVYVPDGDIQEEKGKREDNMLGKVDGKISSSAVEVEAKTEDGPFNKLSVIEEKMPRSSSPTIRVTEPSPVLYTPPSRFDRLKKGFMDRCCAWSCCPCWCKFQGVVHVLVMDPLFDLFITLCIIVNTAFLTIDHHGMSADLQNTLTVGNLVFTGIFGAEALLKMIALGKNYFKDRWNIFDFVVVMVSLLELALVNVKGLSVLRTFRLLRVFKLARSWPTMNMLLSIIGSSLGALANLTVVLVIIVYILAVLGMQLFGEQYRTFYAGNMPRYTFVDFFHAFMMIFRVLCGEWIEPLWECMQAAGSGCIPMFLVTLTLGNFMVLNLFLALLLNSFGADTLSNHQQNQTGNSNKIMAGLNRLRAVLAFKRQKSPKVRPRQDGKEESNSNAESEGGGKLAVISNGSGPSIEMHAMEEGRNKSPNNIKSITSLSTNQDPPSKKSSPRRLAPLDSRALVDEPPITPTVVQHTERAFQAQREAFSRFEETMYQNHGSSVALDSPRSASHAGSRAPSPGARSTSNSPRPKSANSQVSSVLVASPKEDSEEKKEEEVDEEGKPKVTFEETENKEPEDCFPEYCIQNCCLRCSCYNRFTASKHSEMWAAVRKFNFKIVNHKIFEGFILLIIMGSSLCLIFEDIYLETKPQLKAVLYYLDITFVVIFTVEMILKWLGVGFKRYFGSIWCWLDFVIVVISLVSIGAATAGIDNLSAFRALRTLRALRPLRAISRWEGMRVVVNALLQAIPSIFNVLLVCLVFWLICSIMAVQFFGGQFYKCVDGNGNKLDINIVNNRTDCLEQNYTWVNSKVNFDHVGQAYLALLQVATFEGWIEVMSDAVDVRGVDMQPHFENTLYAYIYFVFFIIFGAFFTLNLFIGVIIDTFNVLKKKYDGEASIDLFLTETQRKYYNAMRKLGSKKPQKTINRPKNKCQAALFDFVSSKGFEIGIVILIMLNMVAMAVEHYKQSDTVTYVLALVNIVFTSIFTVEAVLKIIAYRWHYFRVAWNVFDFIVVLLSILGLILDDLLQSVFITPTLLRVVRVFRIGRVLRLVRAAKGIRKLLFALMTSLPALFNIGLLLFLVMFIFAVFGMTSFAYVKKEGALNDMVNFETFGRSLILLFRLTTSAGWNDVLEPLMNENPPECDPNFPNGYWKGNCSVAWLAVAYFVSYIILSFLIVINMYIAVILENFNQAHQQEEDGITEDDFEMFYSVWERYDPYATQFIYYHQLSDFCDNLDEPLRIPKPNTIKIASLNLPVRAGDRIHCIDVLESLTRRVLGEVEDSEEFSELKAQMQKKFQEAFPQLTRHEARTTTFMKKQEDRAARVIQRAYRQWVLRKSIRGASQMWRLRNSNSSLNTADQSPAKLPLAPSQDSVTKSPFLGVRQRWALDQKSAKRTSFASPSDQHAPDNDNDSVERKLSAQSTHSLGQPDPTT